jgi:tight adherence protein B
MAVTAAAGLLTLAAGAWFLARARLGARVRRLGGARLRSVQRIVDARTRAGVVVMATVGGFVLVGPTGAVAGCIGAGAWPWFQRARARRGLARLIDEQVPDVLRSIAAAVRAGRSLTQALEIARDDARPPIRAALDAAVAKVSVGVPLEQAIEVFARAGGTDAVRTAAETLALGHRAGGNFTAILDEAVAAAAERAQIARDRHAATANARMSAAVVGAMPAAFYLLVGGGARAQLLDTLRSPIGVIVIGLGLALEAAGVLWLRSMGRSPVQRSS